MDRWRTSWRGVAAIALAVGLGIGLARPLAAQEYPVIRPTDIRPEQRIDINGTVLSITHVENADQAYAVFFEDERGRYERAAEDPMANPYGLFMTSDMNSEPSLIVLDLSWLATEDGQGFTDLEVFQYPSELAAENPPIHETARIQVQPQQDGSYLARAYWELSKGSMVNNTDWGVQERYTTRDDSINARVDNGPDDDEARAQGETTRTGGDDE